MCLVEVEKAPKPVAACFAQVAPGMRIHTDSEKTRLARGAVMEFLLANHPLDCPICDQGGECDLQDISVKYGYETGRFQEYKRAVEDKDFGPIISTSMNRCIHCTRCVRFAEEIAGTTDLGTIGRGQKTEISTYVETMLASELSGNLADICPVGALTHGPYAFTSRPFELKTSSSIDLMESLIPPVEYSFRGSEIMRALPRVNEDVNEEWLSDKSRYAYDGLSRQRLSIPLKLNRETHQFEELNWLEAMKELASKLEAVKNPEKDLLGLVGQFTSVESAISMKNLFNRLNCENFGYSPYPLQGNHRSSYLLNRSIPEFEELDCLLLVGCNPKYESPILNSRILKAVRKNGLKVYKIGSPDDLGYKYVHLGNSSKTINEILNGKHPFAERLKKAQNAHVVFGSDLENQIECFDDLYHSFKKTMSENYNATVGYLNNFVGPISAREVGINFQPLNKTQKSSVILNFGNDNDYYLKELIQKNPTAYIVYIGTTGDHGASYADLVLPVSAWTESTGTYVSSEGRVQISSKTVPSPGQCKEEWLLIRTLSELLGVKLPYDNSEEIRYIMAQHAPYLMKYDFLEPYTLMNENNSPKPVRKDFIIGPTVDNYYKTDAISRSSLVMAKSSAAFNSSKMSNFLTRPRAG